jgi:hypothetical protein
MNILLNSNPTAMTEDESKKFKVELDHEQKVIRLGCWFYDLKGVLITEATEEDKKKYYCDKFMTYPIVDDDWQVREDGCISDGIGLLVIGKKGDTIPLIKLSEVLDLNVEERYGEYSDILVDLERHGITVANRMEDNLHEELPETITLEIDKIRKTEDVYRIDSDRKGYYIPRRFCHVGKDGILYQDIEAKEKEEGGRYNKIACQIAEDVNSLSWFFNHHHLKVRCQSVDANNASEDDTDKHIPDDWHIAIKTLEDDINSEIQRMQEKCSDDYFRLKRPIVI